MNIEELKQIINNNDAVMVYFSGEFCGVCKNALQEIIEYYCD